MEFNNETIERDRQMEGVGNMRIDDVNNDNEDELLLSESDDNINVTIVQTNLPPNHASDEKEWKAESGNGPNAPIDLNATNQGQDMNGQNDSGRQGDKPNGRKKRRNLCGAEKARRRRARLALVNPQTESDASASHDNKKRVRSPDNRAKVTPSQESHG